VFGGPELQQKFAPCSKYFSYNKKLEIYIFQRVQLKLGKILKDIVMLTKIFQFLNGLNDPF